MSVPGRDCQFEPAPGRCPSMRVGRPGVWRQIARWRLRRASCNSLNSMPDRRAKGPVQAEGQLRAPRPLPDGAPGARARTLQPGHRQQAAWVRSGRPEGPRCLSWGPGCHARHRAAAKGPAPGPVRDHAGHPGCLAGVDQAGRPEVACPRARPRPSTTDCSARDQAPQSDCASSLGDVVPARFSFSEPRRPSYRRSSVAPRPCAPWWPAWSVRASRVRRLSSARVMGTPRHPSLRGPKPRQNAAEQDLFRMELVNLIDERHELVKLASLIDWPAFQQAWGPRVRVHDGQARAA